jgi:hypothetical protein
MEMLARKGIVIASLFLVVSLSACQPGGGQDIVGRWEFGDEDFGAAYEFYEDGSGALFNSLDPFFPLGGIFTYTYDPDKGILETLPTGLPVDKTATFLVSFESKDKISIEQRGKPYEFVRKPLPKLPPGARVRIGGMMAGKSFDLIEAKELAPGWEEEYGDFTAIARTDIEMTVGVKAEEWLVILQVEGEDGPSTYLLRKGDVRWGIIQLISND